MPDPKPSDLSRARVDAIVADSEMALTRQRRLIERLAAAGRPTAEARAFLAKLERHADKVAVARQRLLDRFAEPDPPRRRLMVG